MSRSTILRVLVPALLLAGLLAVNVTPAAAKPKVKACANADAEPSQASTAALGVAAQCLVNNERAKRGMVRLRMNARLSAAAAKHNDDMVANHYFRHESANGDNVVDRVLGTGYIKRALSWVLGENLAWGTEELATPRKIVKAWMRSPGHRHNILTRKFREIGVGVTLGAPQARGRVAATYTTVFGARR